uniref:Caspase-14-like n=1 Tax=Phascolarctos cinereus TaxID=38626 RepID=A0A6P5KDJ4_PHACI|nr:caspase-14-like [Phascolarctos cinereus]
MKIGNDIDARLESQLYLLRSLQEGGVLQNIVLDILCWCGWIPRNYQHQILQRGKKGGPFSLKILSVLTMTLKRQYENDGPKMERYNMEQTRKAFVMCVKTGRPGAEQDMKRMRNWLKACKFECTSCINPDEKGLMEKLREFRDGINKRKDDVSCCLVTLMAHGGKGVIKTVLDERINLSDIFEMFNNKNCPALQKKPKIFIIQACRGGK